MYIFPFDSAIGAMIISIGFYTVMWGKAKEEMERGHHDVESLGSLPSQKTPLLQQSSQNQTFVS